MSVTRHTLTGDLGDLAGGALVDDWSLRSPLRPKARVETNIPDGEALVDTSTGGIVMLGSLALELSEPGVDEGGDPTDQTFTVDLPSTAALSLNWLDLRYRVVIEYPDSGTRTRGGWASPWFELTANRDLRDVVVDEYAPPTATSALLTLMRSLLAQQIDLSNIDTSDAEVAALVANDELGPLTRAAVTDKTVGDVNTGDFTPVGAWDFTFADVTGIDGGGGGGDLAVVTYAGSGATARPTATVVIWEGFPAQPDNMVDGDLWLAPNGGAFLTGTAAPGSGTGVDGDVYLRTSTSMLYGPKASGAWPAGVSLVGPAGTNGTNGTNGVGVPTGGTTGQVLAKSSGADYATGWVTPSAGGSSTPDPRHPTGALAANVNRWETVLGAGNTYVSGTAYFVAVVLVAGVTYNNICFRTASGGLVTPTHSWGTICDASRNRLAVTADDTAAIAANTNKAWPIVGGYTPSVSGLYYVEVMWAAATISILGTSGMGVQQESIPPITGGVGASGQTTPPTVGSTAGGTLSGTSVVPYVWLT